MEQQERAALVAQWQQALIAIRATPIGTTLPEQLLGQLVDELAAGLDAQPFDEQRGARVGAALAEAGLTDAAVPTASAPTLYRLAADRDSAGANERATRLAAALVRGHRERRERFRRESASPEPTGPDTAVADSAPAEGRSATGEMLRIALDHAPVAVAIGHLDGTFYYANPALGDVLGIPVESLRSITAFDFTHPDDVDELNTALFDMVAARSGTVHFERRMVRADGEQRWLNFAVTYVRRAGEEDDYFLAIGQDVTERHRLQEELHWQARHDQLTGLPNRRHLVERIDSVTAAATAGNRLGLCFADLDQFKEINDRYGHNTGDRVLVAVADRLRSSLLDADCTVARVGGDEFVVLIPPPADDDQVTAIADRVLSALTGSLSVGGHRLRVSASIGVVTSAAAGCQADTLLDTADRGLYRAKSSGRQQWRLEMVAPRADE
jgi:diguanylate cyclase (GGDEF)-like protein/PAS domain S-box-containing protein